MVMLADSKLRSQVDSLWDKLWAGGLSNPLDAIEQLSFLLFLKQLDEREQDAERSAPQRRGRECEGSTHSLFFSVRKICQGTGPQKISTPVNCQPPGFALSSKANKSLNYPRPQ